VVLLSGEAGIGKARLTAALVERLTTEPHIRVRQDIIERSDGIPLFIEEMTKAVLEAESRGAAHEMIAAIPSPARAVPASLHASLIARVFSTVLIFGHTATAAAATLPTLARWIIRP
jgi:predicted ATPase